MVERGGREQSSSPLCEGDLCLSTWSPMPSQWISAWWQGLCWSLIHNSPGDHLTHACVSPPLPSSWLGFLHVRNQAQLGEYPHEKCSVSLLLGIQCSCLTVHVLLCISSNMKAVIHIGKTAQSPWSKGREPLTVQESWVRFPGEGDICAVTWWKSRSF